MAKYFRSEIKKTVLVFGSSGVGKTSLLNNLTSEQHDTSSGAFGCTFQTTYYCPVKIGATTYNFIDTTGLNEGSIGKVPDKTAAQNLVQLLKVNKEGFNLLIMVIKKGRITNEIVQQYKLFVKHLVNGAIPVILVVTGCELDDSLSTWVNQNRSAFNTYEMKFSAIVGTTGVSNTIPLMEEYFCGLRNISRLNVIEEIENHSLMYQKSLGNSSSNNILVNIWNFFAKIFKFPFRKSRVTELLMGIGYSEADALEIEKDLR